MYWTRQEEKITENSNCLPCLTKNLNLKIQLAGMGRGLHGAGDGEFATGFPGLCQIAAVRGLSARPEDCQTVAGLEEGQLGWQMYHFP